MQVSRESAEQPMRADTLGNPSWYKSENSLSVLWRGLADVSPPKIASVQKMRGNDRLLIWFLSPDEEPWK